MGFRSNTHAGIRIGRCFLLVFLLICSISRAAGLSVLQQPAVSPDGKEVAFVTSGGIWTVPASGGDAAPLVANMGDVLRPTRR